MGEWIRVDERLPTLQSDLIPWVRTSGNVLICWKDGSVIIGWLLQVAETDGDGNIVSWGNPPQWEWGDVRGPDPDYWMPLPLHPSESGK